MNLDTLALLSAPSGSKASVVTSATAISGDGPVLVATRRRVRPPSGWRLRAIHQLPPPRHGIGPRADVRERLLTRRAFEIARVDDTRPRRIDAILGGAGLTARGTFRMGWAGTVSAWVGDNLVVRAGPGAAVEAAGLTHVAPAQLEVVPRMVDTGVCDGLDWVLETRLAGRRPRRIGSHLIDDVARFCSSLPRTARPEAWPDDVALLTARFPRWADRLAWLGGELAAVAVTVPGILRHGDLWAGNLLVGGRLTGVVDWDAWQPAGFPASDLLHFVTTTERQRKRVALGTIAVQQPWSNPTFVSATASYWEAIGTTPDPEIRRGAGMAWWLGQIAGDVRRTPELADDSSWVAANVDAVLASRALEAVSDR